MPFLNDDLLKTVRELDSSKACLTEEQKQNIASQINDNSGYDMTLLQFAVIHDDRSLVKCLLKLGAKVDICDEYGCLPIHYSDDYGIIKMLVEANTDTIHTRNSYGYFALHRAICKKWYKVVRYLLQQGADPNAKLPDGTTAWDIYPDSETIQNLLERYSLEEYQEIHNTISNQVSPNFSYEEVQENEDTINETNDDTEKTEFTGIPYVDFFDWTY